MSAANTKLLKGVSRLLRVNRGRTQADPPCQGSFAGREVSSLNKTALQKGNGYRMMRRELEAILSQIEKAICGKSEAIQKILMAILAEGHILLDDVPGVGKTTLAVALSRATGLAFNRIQFTPDIMPSDIVGFSIYNKGTGVFDYRPGVVISTNLLLGDEINRTSSKTQSALLEAMEEKQVTVDGKTYPLKTPFIVIATQNSVGTAGTQLLPYAQMDRFMVRLCLGYPDRAAQMDMLRSRQNANPLDGIEQVASLEQVLFMQREVRAVAAKDSILDYITRLVFASREHDMIELGVSPRGALYLDRMAKARAYFQGRDYVIPEDVRTVFCDVCSHRIILSQKARLSGISAQQALLDVVQAVRVPDREH